MLKVLTVWAILIAATAMEATGDAVVRIGLFQKTGVFRGSTLAAGAVLLFGYGIAVNLTRLPFERVVGLYIATLFLVWQLVSHFTFRSVPRTPILVGGTLIIIGGLLVTFWSGAPNADLAKSADAVVATPTSM